MARALKQPGNCHPQGLKKVRALPIHLNSHSYSPSKCQPQPLNTPLKYYVLQLLCFFGFFFSSSSKFEFCVYQVYTGMVTNLLWQSSVAAAHKVSNQSPICPVKGSSERMPKTLFNPGGQFKGI